MCVCVVCAYVCVWWISTKMVLVVVVV